jgi:hypothetical protein
LVATLTRPEACVAAFAATVVTLSGMPREARGRPLAVIVAAFGLPLTAYELFRIGYYGLPLPLPFYVKLASPGALPGMQPVATWLAGELRFVAPLALLLRAPPRHLRPVLAAIAALVAFFLMPQHLMGYASRYLSPLDPAVSVLFGIGMARLVAGEGVDARAEIDLAMGRSARFALAAVSLALPLAVLALEAPAELDERLAYADGLAAAHERLGRELDALRLPGARLAISDAGAVPYLSGWWTLDLLGLNEPHIAVTGSREPAWILAHSPELLVLASTDAERFSPFDWNAFEAPLFEAATAAGYFRVGVRRFAGDYWLWILARRGDEAARRWSLNGISETGSGVARSE